MKLLHLKYLCVRACVGVAEGQRGETVCFERAAEGMAATETRPGKSQAIGGTHSQERETQERDGEILICFMTNHY